MTDQLPAEILTDDEVEQDERLQSWRKGLEMMRASKQAREAAEAEDAKNDYTVDFLEDYRYKGKPLRIREKLFVANLLASDFKDPGPAFRAAGFVAKSDEDARANALRMMRKDRVGKALELAIQRRMLRLNITGDRVLEELSKLTFANLSDVIEWDEDGNVKFRPREEVPEHALHAINEITQIRNVKTGELTTKVKMTDKLNAVTAMMKHLGMLNQKIEMDVNVKASDAMAKARERVIQAYKQGDVYETDDD